MRTLRSIALVATTLFLLIGCGRNRSDSAATSNKVRVGYIGITCEAPIFTAVEKGFFKEEGLDASLVKCEWASYKDVLALGGGCIAHHEALCARERIERG